MTGQFVTSKAGHDKNEIYIIIEETGRDVLLVNGEGKRISNPKRKNRKHVTFLNKHLTEEQKEVLEAGKAEADLMIKHEIRLYKKEKIEA